MKQFLTLILIAFTSSLFAQSKPFEGVLRYKITERNAAGDIVVNGEANGEITIHVKGDKLLMEIFQVNVYDAMIDTMDMYYLQDFSTKKSFIGMKMIDNLYCMEEELDEFTAGEFKPLKIKSKTIQGLSCNAAEVVTTGAAEMEGAEGEKQISKIWYTNAYTCPHLFFGQFINVPGMVTSVEEKGAEGTTSIIELVAYTAKPLREEDLQIPAKYKRVTYEELLELYPILEESFQN